MRATRHSRAIWVTLAGAILLAGGLAAVAADHWGGHGAAVTTTAAAATSNAPARVGGGDPAAGKAIFTSSGCSGCHTMAAVGATGTVGPNLDEYLPPLTLIVDRVTHGTGTMPSFKSRLSVKQIKDVAAFVYANELRLSSKG